MGTTLNVTARGQVTFRKEILRHMGIKPGEKIEVELRPGGQVGLKAHTAKRKGNWEDLFGTLAGKTDVKLTIEEIKEATEKAWAGEL